MVAEMTHSYVITVIRAALNCLIISDAKSITINAEKYFVIKRTLFIFKTKVYNN